MSSEANKILSLLSKHNDLWLRYAEKITQGHPLEAKDLLQEFYLKIHDKVVTEKVMYKHLINNDNVSKSFIYRILTNMFIDITRKKNNIVNDYELSENIPDEIDDSVDRGQIVDDIIKDWYWFDRKLFDLYRFELNSMDKLSKATKISRTVCWKTINKCIKEIKKKINEK